MEIRDKIIKEKEYVFSESEMHYIKEALEHALWDWRAGLDDGGYELCVDKIENNVRIVSEIMRDILVQEEENE